MDGIDNIILTLMMISIMLSAIFLISWASFGRKPHAMAWSVAFGLSSLQWLGNLTASSFPSHMAYWMTVSCIGYVVPTIGLSGFLLRAGRDVPIFSMVIALLIAQGLTLWSYLPGGHMGLSVALAPIYTALAISLSVWVLSSKPKKNGAEWGAITVNCLFTVALVGLATIALDIGAEYNKGRADLFTRSLFLTLPTIFTGMGLFMVVVLASDLADQVREFAKKEQDRLSAEAAQYWDTLQDVIATIPELVAIEDGNGQIVACNDQFASLVGQTKNELVGQNMVEYFAHNAALFLYVDDKTVDETGIQVPRALKRGLETGDQITVQMANNRTFVVDCAHIHTGGNILVAHDVTEIRRITMQLEDAIASMPLAFALFDSEGKFIACNKGMESFHGGADSFAAPHSLSELLSSLTDQLNTIDGVPLASTKQWKEHGVLENAVKSDANFLGEFKDGRSFQISSRQSGDGGCVFIAHDLTDHRKLEEELKDQREALFQSEKLNALGTLLAGVAHELNNPLTIVVANAHVLSMVSENPELVSRVEKITDAAERCSKIVHAFLAMARKGQAKKEPYDISICIENAINICGFGYRQHDIELECRLDPALPILNGDEDHISQAILNLLLNAQHALADTEYERKVSIHCHYDQRAQQVLLEVKDTGPGISEDIRAQIFDPFFTTKQVGSGTGLGLFLVRGIIESHKGTVELQKNGKMGASFKISLPAEVSPAVQFPCNTPLHDQLAALRVLAVDDEMPILDVLKDILEHGGHSVSVKSTGGEVLDYLLENDVDVLMTDLRMQGMSGSQLFAVIEEQYPALAERTIVMTGDSLSEESEQFLKQFTGPVLEKPFSPEGVKKALGKLFSQQTAKAS